MIGTHRTVLERIDPPTSSRAARTGSLCRSRRGRKPGARRRGRWPPSGPSLWRWLRRRCWPPVRSRRSSPTSRQWPPITATTTRYWSPASTSGTGRRCSTWWARWSSRRSARTGGCWTRSRTRGPTRTRPGSTSRSCTGGSRWTSASPRRTGSGPSATGAGPGCWTGGASNNFTDRPAFCNGGVIAENDPVEQEKAVKLTSLLANCVIFHTTLDLMNVVRELQAEEEAPAAA
ncbi:Tn3 family transposase [Streptomyces sp. NPDC057966]|uniref:Tn3 family transposase n=1 Tax=Streptomyces sp. NPDC057966 TaxID=3346292 RepID=UPI0036EF7BAE